MDKSITFTEFFKAHRSDFDAVLFDIDGTLALDNVSIPGAAELISYLDDINFPYLYLTNDSCHSAEQKSEYLKKKGVPARRERVLSAGHALKLWSAKHYHGGKYFLLGSMGNPSYVDLAGISYTDDPEQVFECCGVICGEGVYNWQRSIEGAFNLLLRHPEYPIIVSNPDSYWASMRTKGWGIGSGAITRFICQVLYDAGKNVTPVYLGKPSHWIYQCAFPFLKSSFPDLDFFDPKRIIMVGDCLTSDIIGANTNGLSSALVLTGVTSKELLANAPENQRPDMVFASV